MPHDDLMAAIGADLSAKAREKRRHFLPAVIAVCGLVLGLLAMAGVRGDFAALPLWRQLSLGGAWLVCGLLFPAVGVGLWFPTRGVRVALVVAGIALPLAAVLGWPPLRGASAPAAPCGLVLLALGACLVAVGAFSGAFAQRRSVQATAWVASGLTLSAMATTSWVCPVDAVAHLAWGHVVPAVGLTALAMVVGRWLHARQRR